MTIQEILDDVNGWLFIHEAEMLARYAHKVMPPDVIVEIGSFQGRSTVIMALESVNGVKVYAIDPHIPSEGDPYQFTDGNRAIWATNMLKYGVGHCVRPINLKSQQVAKIWEEPIGLLFIDGAHGYDAVKADLDGFLPFVVPDGAIIMHDTNGFDIVRVITEREDLIEIEAADISVAYKIKR